MGKRGKSRRQLKRQRDADEEGGADGGSEGQADVAGLIDSAERAKQRQKIEEATEALKKVPLLAFAPTIACVARGCVVCAYRLLVYRPESGALPNERPEMCLRMRAAIEVTSRSDEFSAVPDSHPLQQSSRRWRNDEEESSSKGDDGSKAEEEVSAKEAGEEGASAGEGSSEAWVGLYTGSQRVVVVGDGNLSFSRALAEGLHEGKSEGSLVASSVEEEDKFYSVYRAGKENVAAIRAVAEAGGDVKVLFEVDATKMGSDKRLGTTADIAVFNFPCVRLPGGFDAQNQHMVDNIKLVESFCRQACSLVGSDGQVHITHKTKAAFSQWNIPAIATSAGLHATAAVVFDPVVYPGYNTRKALASSSFPNGDARTFVLTSPGSVLPEGETMSLQAFLDAHSDSTQWREADADSIPKRFLCRLGLFCTRHHKGDAVERAHVGRRLLMKNLVKASPPVTAVRTCCLYGRCSEGKGCQGPALLRVSDSVLQMARSLITSSSC